MSCHFRDCKALLSMCSSCSSAVSSTGPLPYTGRLTACFMLVFVVAEQPAVEHGRWRSSGRLLQEHHQRWSDEDARWPGTSVSVHHRRYRADHLFNCLGILQLFHQHQLLCCVIFLMLCFCGALLCIIAVITVILHYYTVSMHGVGNCNMGIGDEFCKESGKYWGIPSVWRVLYRVVFSLVRCRGAATHLDGSLDRT